MHDFDLRESGPGPVESFSAPRIGQSGDRTSRPGILVDILPRNARIVVTTKNSRYDIKVLDGAERRISITGGKVFPDATEMLLEGANTDFGMIEPGWISVGMPVTLSTGVRRITTSRVESVMFDRVPSAVRAA
jgi:hypothetical protein